MRAQANGPHIHRRAGGLFPGELVVERGVARPDREPAVEGQADVDDLARGFWTGQHEKRSGERPISRPDYSDVRPARSQSGNFLPLWRVYKTTARVCARFTSTCREGVVPMRSKLLVA